MPAHYHAETFNNGGTPVAYAVTKENEGSIDDKILFASIATDAPIVLALDVSAATSLCFVADKACTIKTNDATTPAQTIDLVAGKPLRWHDGMTYANPLTVDITSAFVSCAAGTTLKIMVLYDATP